MDNSLARSTTSTPSVSLRLLVSTRFQILFHSPPGVLFTFPSRYFSLSVTGIVFSLGRRSSRLPAGFHVSRSTLLEMSCRAFLTYTALTFSGGSLRCLRLLLLALSGLVPFRSPLLRESMFLSFPPATKMFQFAGFPLSELLKFSLRSDRTSSCRVSPFGHPRFIGFRRLPGAFRSLSRPSSASSARASAPCSYFLDLRLVLFMSNT